MEWIRRLTDEQLACFTECPRSDEAMRVWEKTCAYRFLERHRQQHPQPNPCVDPVAEQRLRSLEEWQNLRESQILGCMRQLRRIKDALEANDG